MQPVPRAGAGFYERLKDVTPAAEPGDIAWNLTKFLIGRDGEVVTRYAPPVTPEETRVDLERMAI